jgi:Secretion system C-terminal sorting domain
MEKEIRYCINSCRIGFFFTILFLFIFSSSLYAQWIQSNGPGSPVVSLLVQGTDLYAGTTTSRGTGGVYVSTISNPTVWTPVNSGLVNHYVSKIGAYNSDLFAGTYPSGPLYRYAGGSWDTVAIGNDTYVTAFATQNNYFFAGTFLRGVYRSTNAGISWAQVNTGLQAFPAVQCFALNGTSLFLGTSDSGIYRSTDFGSSWTHSSNGLFNLNIYALAVVDTILFASVPGGFSFSVYRSTNNGVNWDQVNTQGQPAINQFAVSGRNIFGVTFGAGIYLSTDLGVTWDPVNNGIPNGLTMLSIAVRGTNLYAGSSYSATIDGLVYYRPLSEMITGINEVTGTPTKFSLEQNFPNPFNPATVIHYSLVESGLTSLKVYTSLGKEIVTLVNQKQNAGVYEITFDGANLPSGVYYYKITVEGNRGIQYTSVKKMILMK